ncbi:MAG: L-threonine 3-dehydrogenase [Pseudomonadota bacterium]
MKVRSAAGAELGNVEVPKPGPEDALIKVKATSICGTDVHIYHWDEWAASRIKTPLVFGHECSGEVVEVGKNVKNLKVGAHVSVETHIACETCYQCTHGQEHVCQNVKVVGIDRPGAFTEYICLPARNAWVNSDELPWEVGSVLEPYGNAVHTVNAGEGVNGKTVLVSGCGPIGVMAIGVAKAMGASAIYGTDISDYRLQLARQMGPTAVYNAKDPAHFDQLKDAMHGLGFDVLLEMSGSPAAMEDGFKLLRNGGTAVLLGLPSAPIKFDFSNYLVLKGTKVYGIYGREIYKTWAQGRELVDSKKIDLTKVITHYIPMEKFAEAMALMESGKSGKIIFRM